MNAAPGMLSCEAEDFVRPGVCGFLGSRVWGSGIVCFLGPFKEMTWLYRDM